MHFDKFIVLKCTHQPILINTVFFLKKKGILGVYGQFFCAFVLIFYTLVKKFSVMLGHFPILKQY